MPPNGSQTRLASVFEAEYLKRHLTLGYAATVHSAQGVTADSCCYAILSEGQRKLAPPESTSMPASGSERYAHRQGKGTPVNCSEIFHSRLLSASFLARPRILA